MLQNPTFLRKLFMIMIVNQVKYIIYTITKGFLQSVQQATGTVRGGVGRILQAAQHSQVERGREGERERGTELYLEALENSLSCTA